MSDPKPAPEVVHAPTHYIVTFSQHFLVQSDWTVKLQESHITYLANGTPALVSVDQHIHAAINGILECALYKVLLLSRNPYQDPDLHDFLHVHFSFESLAQIILAHLTIAAHHPQSPVSHDTLQHFSTIGRFIASHGLSPFVHAGLYHALTSQGSVSRLTTALVTSSCVSLNEYDEPAALLFTALDLRRPYRYHTQPPQPELVVTCSLSVH
ncbi:hypothetical protein C8R45DRAFT_1114864 [Mycena sanguinolenta]|nr:hypothetical protein C8R45DRAFT_1114864 [Mycena sanguinolenta]